jgi:hypothetical protein
MKDLMRSRILHFALAWAGTNATFGAVNVVFTDLHPAGATGSYASAVDATGQAGTATYSGVTHAAMWLGTAASFVDLNPAGASSSRALGGGGALQGEVAAFPSPLSYTHAAVWSGSAGSYADYDPGFTANSSIMYAATPSQQGGAYTLKVGAVTYSRVLWWSPASGAIDLTPTTSTGAVVWGFDDASQVGQITVSGVAHAALWSGTPDSCVDLHPAGATYSIAYACQLQSSASLTGAWNPVATPPVTNGDWISVVTTNAAAAQFFRLLAN